MEVHDLLSHKDFEELTAAERQAVLTEMTQEEYESQRQIIRAQQALWASELPQLQPQPPQKALQALKNKQNPPIATPKTTRVSLHKLRAWQVAAILFAGLFLCQLLVTIYNNNKPHLLPTPTLVYQTDTLYLERYHTITDTLIQPADTIIKVVYETLDTVTQTVQPVFARASQAADAVNNLAYYTEQMPIDIWDYYENNSTAASSNQDTFLQNLTQQVAKQVNFTSSNW